MKSATTLKELLKPPYSKQEFSHFLYDNDIKPVLELNTIWFDKQCALDIRTQIKYELLEYIAQALNEKWEREFGEPLRWIWSGLGIGLDCPSCGQSYAVGDTSKMMWDRYAYCSCCGQRLLPPENS